MLKSLLAEIVFYRTYAETKKDGYKETWLETVERVQNMHVRKYPQLTAEIVNAFDYVRAGVVVPSMRSMQFAGPSIERENARLYNCSYSPLESFKDFADLMYLLLCGTGVGFSVQRRHIHRLPEISEGVEQEVFVFDSKEGWCNSILSLLSNPKATFDYSAVRPKGSKISTGGTASGPEPLIEAHEKIRAILLGAVGRKLSSIEAHDIMCHIADSVVVGGVRRSAMISLFDADDEAMIRSKEGSWWDGNGQRARANNSIVLHRESPSFKADLEKAVQRCLDSEYGEPGVFITEHWDYGTNPCAEISLKPRQFCNLTEVNVARCKDYETFLSASIVASFLGTLQAGFTDFGYIQPEWSQNQREEALLGVSLTGQAERPDLMTPSNLRKAAMAVRQVNELTAKEIGINPGKRLTCVKPSGTTSAVLDTTSGIHAAHAEYYIRRVRVDSSHPLGKYLASKVNVATLQKGQFNFLEQDAFNPNNIIVAMPYHKDTYLTRTAETSIQLLERMRNVSYNWVQPGHREGPNFHNVSLTVSVRPEEKAGIKEWMVNNVEFYTGISLLPYSGGGYVQLPFEDITKEQYEEYSKLVPQDLDLASVKWEDTEDARQGEAACAGGACEII